MAAHDATKKTDSALDYRTLFEASPGPLLILTPEFEIVAVTDAYCSATMTRREDIVGKGIFDVFPDNPDDPAASGVANLRRSLHNVLDTLKADKMATQRYDIRRPGGKVFEVRYWSLVNSPVVDSNGEVALIIHKVEDATDLVQLKNADVERQLASEELQRRATRLASELRLILESVRLFLWYATVVEVDGERQWNIRVADEDRARRILPIREAPAQEFVQAWYLSKLEGDREQSNQASEAAFRTNAPRYTSEYRCRLASGEIRWFFEDVQIEQNGPNNFNVMGACVDVTELKEAEAKVEAERVLLQTVIDTLPDSVFVKNVHSRIILVNNATLELLGAQDYAELENKTDFELFPEEAAQRFYADEQSLLAGTEEIVNNMGTYPDKVGDERWLWTTKVPLRDADGKVVGIVGVNRDITQRKQEETALRLALQAVEEARANSDRYARLLEDQAEKLREANEELESFSYSVSHDLRAPLRHISGYVKMLEKDTEGLLDEQAMRYLRVIASASKEMGQLIDDLLSFARAGRMEMQTHPLQLATVVEDIVCKLAAETPERDIDWRIGTLPDVVGDSALIRLVLSNLIGNAVKYSRNREHAVIEIGTAGGEDGQVVIFVRDNGVGFEMQYAHNLFGVFQRLHRADEFEGTGIGLAMVRRIISRHGGRTWAEAELDKGATFYFTLAKCD